MDYPSAIGTFRLWMKFRCQTVDEIPNIIHYLNPKYESVPEVIPMIVLVTLNLNADMRMFLSPRMTKFQ